MTVEPSAHNVRPTSATATEEFERRSAPRYPLITAAEMTDLNAGTQLSGRTSDLGLGGCYVDTLNPLREGTLVRLRLLRSSSGFETLARVACCHAGFGMGLVFIDPAPDQQSVLEGWLPEFAHEVDSDRQRSQRVLLHIPIVVRGQTKDNRSFQEETHTLLVSAHEAMVLLRSEVLLGQPLVLLNPKTKQERQGYVIYRGMTYAGATQVAVELTQPASDSWPMDDQPSYDPNQCCIPGCEKSVAASLDMRLFCHDHFLEACYDGLEACSQRLQNLALTKSDDDWADRKFLEESTRQAARISQTANDLDNLSKARLLNILLWAADLSPRLRRSLRKAVGVPIRLRFDMLGDSWEEETQTQVVSRYGAQVECQYPARVGEALYIVRLDSGQQAEARVVWRRHMGADRFQIGLEFAKTTNFWNFE